MQGRAEVKVAAGGVDLCGDTGVTRADIRFSTWPFFFYFFFISHIPDFSSEVGEKKNWKILQHRSPLSEPITEEPLKQIPPDRTRPWLSRAGETDTTITANSPCNEWTRTQESADGKRLVVGCWVPT